MYIIQEKLTKNHPFPRYQSTNHAHGRMQSRSSALALFAPRLRPSTHQQSLLHICRRKRLNHTGTIHKPRPENPVRIREHAILQTDNNELTAAEASADQAANILCM
jgi:hypothetical protein